MFYASPPVVARGEKTLLCFGVENAKAVRIEPDVEPVRPSPSRCLEFAPHRTAVYTITATGETGAPATQSVTIRVTDRKAAAPSAPAQGGAGRLIELFTTSAETTQPGAPVTLCYIVRGADSVRLEPGPALGKTDKACINVTPQRTTTYTLTATAGDKSDHEKVTIRVR